MCDMIGRTATLKEPRLGYTRIRIVGRSGYMWEVELCGSGKTIFVYGDEFDPDE